MSTSTNRELEEIKLELNRPKKQFLEYLYIKRMRADDRTYPWIAKKLGYNNASSIINRESIYGWIDSYVSEQLRAAETRAKYFAYEYCLSEINENPLTTAKLNIYKEKQKLQSPSTQESHIVPGHKKENV